jgi:hypothetical protein
MKPTEFIVETSQIAQEADNMHADHEVQMARADCYNAAKYAIELHKLLKNMSESQGLDGWVSEKITLANDYLRMVHEYLKYENVAQPDMMGFTAEAAEYAFDQLLVEDDYDDAVKDYFSKGGKVEKLPAKKPRQSEKTDFSSKHIGGKGEVGRGKSNRIGKAAKTDPKGKPVVTAESDQKTMSRAAKGHEKYGKEGMAALAKAGREGASEKKLDAIRDRHDKYSKSRQVSEMGETGEERAAAASRENQRYDNASNYQGRNARGDVIRSGGEVVRGNPNPPSLIQRAAGALGLPNTAKDALGDPMYKSSKPASGGSRGGGGGGVGGHLADPSAVKSLIPNFESKRPVKENATGGGSSAGGIATSMGGPGHKPTSGVPKKLGNAAKMKKVTVGKGIY